MGLRSSKPSKGGVKKTKPTKPVKRLSGAKTIHSTSIYDERAISELKKEFSDNIDMFLVNNLLMSVMFYENFEKEIGRSSAPKSPEWESSINQKLIKDHQKQILMPDTVFDNVNKHVRMRPFHGPKKNVAEFLTPQRMYILHDNVEVQETEESSHYSGIDKPTYKATMISSNSEGFIKLKMDSTEIPKADKKKSSMDSSYSSLYNTKKSSDTVFPFPEELSQPDRPPLAIPPDDDSGRSSMNTTEYDYTRITNLRTPQPLKVWDKDCATYSASSLPCDCITPVRAKNLKTIDDYDDEDYNGSDYKIRTEEMFVVNHYFNSTNFMKYFKNNVFPNHLAEVLGFNASQVRGATSVASSIYCDTKDSDGNSINCEVIPSVAIPWPGMLVVEWMLRDRPRITDTRSSMIFQWPTDKMVKDIRALQCVATPMGYVRKKGTNYETHLEWQVAFPKAEKFLETKMTHTQMRAFLFLLTLHKTFIEPQTRKQGLLSEHFRTLMFWEIEANYRDWPEDRLGYKMKRVLKNLYSRLAGNCLYDYFVSDRNVFTNIPRKYLLPAQTVIHKIIETPLPYFLLALRNLRYMSGKFYPVLDFKRFYELLLSNEGIQVVNPDLYETVQQIRGAQFKPQTRRNGEFSDAQKWQIGAIRMEQIQRQKQEQEKKNLNNERRQSADSIDLTLTLGKKDDIVKKGKILIFFIEHFIEMAKASIKLATSRQALFYLKQAYYLNQLLRDIAAFEEDFEDFTVIIKNLEDRFKRHSIAEQSAMPSTPTRTTRNSFHFHGSEILQVKGQKINMNNLNKSYAVGPEVSKPLQKEKKKKPPNLEIVVDVHENKGPKSPLPSTSEVQVRNQYEKVDRRKTVSFQVRTPVVEEDEPEVTML